MSVSTHVPWWAKIAAKLMLSRLPVPYGVWAKLGVFRHGDMKDPRRAMAAFVDHLERARAVRPLPAAFTMLELGPGDSVLSAAVARAFGAKESWLVDVGDFADRNPELFYALERELAGTGATLDLPNGLTFDAILDFLGARYLTSGVQSLREIPSASVDLIWSSVVVEHILRAEFERFASQLARILKPDGVMSHAVDLRDHLGGSLNNLRFAPELWESEGWRRAGFYTNRLSQNEIVAAFQRAGLRVAALRNDNWPEPPVERRRLHPSFRQRNDDELRIAGFDLVMVHANG